MDLLNLEWYTKKYLQALLRKTKKKCYEDLRLTDVNHNIKFGKLSAVAWK